MTASLSEDLLPTVLADLLSLCGSSDGQGVLLGLPGDEAWTVALSGTPLGLGDRVVTTRAGEDSARWASMAADLGYDVVCIDVPPGAGPSLEELTHLLWWDASVKAVFVARDETSTGITADVAEVRRVMDLTGSDALLLVDCSAVWGSDEVPQRTWSADMIVTALGTPHDGSDAGTLVTWSERLSGMATLPNQAAPPIHDVLVRLRSQLDYLDATGRCRQTRRWLGEGLRRALAAAGLEGVAAHNPSDAVTVVHLPAGLQSPPLEQVLAAHCRTPTDLGVGALAGRVLRVWHAGLRNEVDVLAAVCSIELALVAADSLANGGSGLAAARSWFDTSRADAR